MTTETVAEGLCDRLRQTLMRNQHSDHAQTLAVLIQCLAPSRNRVGESASQSRDKSPSPSKVTDVRQLLEEKRQGLSHHRQQPHVVNSGKTGEPHAWFTVKKGSSHACKSPKSLRIGTLQLGLQLPVHATRQRLSISFVSMKLLPSTQHSSFVPR